MLEKNMLGNWPIHHETLCAVFQHACNTCPDSLFCSENDTRLSYRQGLCAVENLAAVLGAERSHKTVALILPNSAAFLIAYYGVLRAGAVPALINAAIPEKGLQRLLADLAPDLVISDRKIKGYRTLVLCNRQIDDFAQKARPDLSHIPMAVAEDVAAIFYSGGTTGHPKRIRHSHRTLIAKMARMEWGWPTRDQETWLPVAPFTHIYGYLMGVSNPILKAAHIIIPPKFKPDQVVALLARERVTVFGGGPPAIYQALMSAENFEAADLSALRVCPGGGAGFPVALHHQWRAKTGLTITEGLGMTEIAPIAVNTQAAGIRFGTVGKPCPDTTVEIVDLDTGTRQLPPGETGEIRVKGPHMMTGYDDNPQETAETLRDGFIYTGDIGAVDEDGFLTITDRKKDVIFHKGFNVFPREIEETLMAADGVTQACVVGAPDDRAGEIAVAFVKASTSAEVLLDHCKLHLTAYKVPNAIHLEDELPLTPAGKLDRIALRARLAATASPI